MFNKSTIDDFFFRPPFTCILAGSSKCGKTYFAEQFIRGWSHSIPDCAITRFSLVYTVWQDAYQRMIDSLPPQIFVETHVGLPLTNEALPLPSEVEVTENAGRHTRPLCRLGVEPVKSGTHVILIDDVLQGHKTCVFLTNLFTILSNHSNISVFLLTQDVHNNTQLNRLLIRNTEELVVFRSALANGILRAIQQQYFYGEPGYLTHAYKKATSSGSRYLNIDLSADCHHAHRVKSGILQNEVIFPYIFTFLDTNAIRLRRHGCEINVSHGTRRLRTIEKGGDHYVTHGRKHRCASSSNGREHRCAGSTNGRKSCIRLSTVCIADRTLAHGPRIIS